MNEHEFREHLTESALQMFLPLAAYLLGMWIGYMLGRGGGGDKHRERPLPVPRFPEMEDIRG